LAFSYFQAEIFFLKKTHKEKKNHHKEEKNVKKGRSLPFFSRFCIWDEALLLLSPLHIPSTLNFPPSWSLVFHISSKLCATQAQELSLALEMEWTGNEVREVGRGVSRRGKFWGKEGAKKSLGRGRGYVFGSSPKQLKRPHPELVHWWLLVHSSRESWLGEGKTIAQRTKRINLIWGKKSMALGSNLNSPSCLLWNYAERHWDSAQNLSLWWTLLWSNFQLNYFDLNHICFHWWPIKYFNLKLARC
jgi:hypothetical protein